MATNTGGPVSLNKNASSDTVASALLTGQNANMDKINTAIGSVKTSLDEVRSRQTGGLTTVDNANYSLTTGAWYVRSGICFVRYEVVATTRSAGWVVTASGLPIPSLANLRGVCSATQPSVDGLHYMVNTEGNLIFVNGQTGTRYWGEFSYPIESYKV